MKKPRPRAIKQRAARTAAVTAPNSALAAEAVSAAPTERKTRTSPGQFFSQVRAEALKITWPSWKETYITSVMVFIMVVLTGVFFLIVDTVLHWGIDFVLKFATAGSQ